MITEQQIEEMLEQQMKIPLLRRAMGVDLPPDEGPFWEEFNELTKDRFGKFEKMVSEHIKNFNEYMEIMK